MAGSIRRPASFLGGARHLPLLALPMVEGRARGLGPPGQQVSIETGLGWDEAPCNSHSPSPSPSTMQCIVPSVWEALFERAR